MATTGLELKVGADVVEVTQSLKQLQNDLKDLGKTLKSAIPGTASFDAASAAFTRQKAIISALNNEVKKTAPAFQAAAAAVKTLAPGANQASFALTNLGRVAQDAPFGFIGIQNNINPLLESFGRLKQETGSTGAALKALAGSFLGPAGLGVAVSLATSALTFFFQAQQKAKKETQESKKDTDGYIQSLTKQKVELEALANIARNGALAEDDRVRALKRLNEIIPDSIGLLNKQNIATAEGSNILRQYVKAIEARATAELLVNRIAENNIKLFDLRNSALANTAKFEEDILNIRAKAEKLRSKGQFEAAEQLSLQIKNIQASGVQAKAQEKNRKEAQALLDANQKLRAEYERILPPVIEINDKVTETKNITNEYKAAVEGILSAYIANNAALKEQATLQTLLLDLQRKSNELTKGGIQPTQPLGLTNEQQLILAGDDSQVGAVLENIEAIKKKLIDVSDLVNNGINAGLDQFFNAIANNQDPFEALAQSAKRLVAELGAAVVKALVLKAITSAFTGGAGILGGGGGLLSNLIGSKGVLRGDQIRALTFLRG